jgi:hypothetical protein
MIYKTGEIDMSHTQKLREWMDTHGYTNSSLAEELGIKDYSETIAMRFLDHYHGFKEEYEVCDEMGEHIAQDISSHLPKPIGLEFENVFVSAEFMAKKRYACIVLDRDKMIVKQHPDKMYTKGIMLARRDNCKWARELFKDALFNILIGKSRVEISLLVQDHLQRLLTWGVPLENLQIIQKLGFDYKSETYPLKLFSEHLKEIGKPANANDRIPFIVGVNPNSLVTDPAMAKLGHYYRLPETIREEVSDGKNTIDYLYYIERLKNDINQIFSIGYLEEIASDTERRLDRELGKLYSEIEVQRTRLVDLGRQVEVMERRLEKQSAEKSSIQLKRDVKEAKKQMSLIEKHIEKLTKSETRIRKPTKTTNVGLRLDERMFDHICLHIANRNQVMKQIVTEPPRLKPVRREKAVQQMDLKGWLVKRK